MSKERESLLLRVMVKQELQRREEIARCKEWTVAHDAGPMYWLRKWTKTENYHWKQQGRQPVDHFPYKPFPGGKLDLKQLPFPHRTSKQDPPDYLDIVMGYLLSTKELFIPKTREMMTSWLVVGFITWFCQFYEKVEWIGQSEDDLKAQGLIKYANILYSNQPEWMKAKFALKRGDEGTMHRIEWANGSSFLGVPSGVRKLASSHPFGYFNDETAHQPGAEATINIAKPAVKQIVCVSSAAPGWFGDQCELKTG